MEREGGGHRECALYIIVVETVYWVNASREGGG